MVYYSVVEVQKHKHRLVGRSVLNVTESNGPALLHEVCMVSLPAP